MAKGKKKPEGKKKDLGRPSAFTQEIADEICLRLAQGESLRRICREKKFPDTSTVYRWLLTPKGEEQEAFYDQYARAREAQAENMFDEILDIADDGENDYMTVTKGDKTYNVEDREVTNRSRLRVDSRKWYLSKVLPKKFGDKLDLTSDGKAFNFAKAVKDYGKRKTDPGDGGEESGES